MSRLPFPSNENSLTHQTLAKDTSETPWKRTNASEPPLMMFQMQLSNGNVRSFAYCDLRETRLLSAGYLQLCLYGMEKYHITIEGRHLSELSNLIGMGRIKSLVEMGPRTFEHPEESPAIDKITIEALTGPT